MGKSSQPENRPFAGKIEQIKQQHADFWSYETAAADVKAYHDKNTTHIYPNRPKWIKAATPFTEWKGNVFAESENALLVGNHASFDIGQYPGAPQKAGMSSVHILGIPKAGIYNGVTLDSSNVSIIDEMIGLFKQNWPKPEFQEAVLLHQEARIETQNKAEPDSEAYEEAINHQMELELAIDSLKVDDFTFGFHLYPDHSVGHLHMHIIATPAEYRQYSTDAHDEKTRDAIEVRDFIRSLSQV
ncbi:hypothetical protein F4821DRAFT_186139 [Hypoxylon rubiginosum]|uniref:Uncharacterized protein n=1 Tax=Hypoxylon rubiginosum TaxID=110542 RepID=A0ACC0DF39_9PEZI|nr:hypothetical protein F4821DRAFT_186139 [Hypoxylon rubiginosum]